jgi:2-dehydro-3-deoxygluconokinase
MRWADSGRMGLYFVEMGADPRPIQVLYDRAGSAMAAATADMFDWPSVCQSRVFHVSGITQGLSVTSAKLVRTALDEAKHRGCLTSFDVNYRQMLWPVSAAAAALETVAPMIDVLICTAEDARDLFGMTGEGLTVATALQVRLGVRTVVVTMGSRGALALQDGSACERGGYQVAVIDRIGAGDAFAAGLLWGLLEGSLEAGLERGLAMSALKMTIRGDLFRFNRSDVELLLGRSQREVPR